MSFTLEGVTYSYPGAKSPSLQGVSLGFPARGIVALLGRNGAGKTTLLNLLGLLWEGELDTGSITYRGPDRPDPRPFAGMSPAERAELRRSHFGYVAQSAYLLPYLSCAENLALPLLLRGHDPGYGLRKAEELLRQADGGTGRFLEKKDRYHTQVSGGEAQCMAVLRGVIHEPHVVFADEPDKSLDELDNKERVLKLLTEWQRGRFPASANGQAQSRTLVLVSHDLQQALKVADHFVLVRGDHCVVDNKVFSKDEIEKGGGVDYLKHLLTGDGSP